MSKKAYIVIAHANTGSGSLTWPEDFQVLGVFLNAFTAEHTARTHNIEQLKSLGEERDGMSDMEDDEIEDLLYGCDDAMIAVVEETNLNE